MDFKKLNSLNTPKIRLDFSNPEVRSSYDTATQSVAQCIAESIKTGVTVVECAQKNNVNLSDPLIREAIKQFSPRSIEEYKVISSLIDDKDCCTGNCGNNLCANARMEQGLFRTKSLDEQIVYLSDIVKSQNLNTLTRQRALVHGVSIVVAQTQDKEHLEKLKKVISSLREYFPETGLRDQDIVEKIARIRHENIKEYFDDVFAGMERSVADKLAIMQ